MTTNRRRPDRNKRHISPQAIEAWKRADYSALHMALDLHPWQSSPLPIEVSVLGVSEDYLDEDDEHYQDDLKSLALQREFLALCGWPDCREVYEKELREAERSVAYYRDLVEHPEHGGIGTGCDPISRRRSLEEAEARVEYRRELLAELAAVQAKWAPPGP
jgi:hypothetical protein